MQKEGKIRNLLCQPVYDLWVKGELICTHEPDFDYDVRIENGEWLPEVLEVKGDWAGSRLPVWKIKHKLFCACYPEIKYKVV